MAGKTKIKELGIENERINNYLKKCSIGTVEDLIGSDVRTIKLKSRDFNELVHVLLRNGYCFKSDVETVKLVNKASTQIKLVENMITLFKDYGAYKRRKLYRLSDLEYEEEMKKCASALYTMVLNQVVSEDVVVRLRGEERHKELLDYVMMAIRKDIKNAQNEKRKSS